MLKIEHSTLYNLLNAHCLCKTGSVDWKAHAEGCPFRNLLKGSKSVPDKVGANGRPVHEWSRSNPYPR